MRDTTIAAYGYSVWQIRDRIELWNTGHGPLHEDAIMLFKGGYEECRAFMCKVLLENDDTPKGQ